MPPADDDAPTRFADAGIGLLPGLEECHRSKDADIQSSRERFLITAQVSSDVRPLIAQSWIRAWRAGYRPNRHHPLPWGVCQSDSPTAAAVKAEVLARAETLASNGITVLLVDQAARLTGRWFGGAEDHLISSWGKTRSSLAESQVGTHAANVALETRQPCQVLADEHLCPTLRCVDSVALPLVHPVSGRLTGVLSAERQATQANELLLPWLGEIVRAVADRLKKASTQTEELLLKGFMDARNSDERPVICLSHHTVLCNAAASKLIGTHEQALLWEHTRRFLAHQAEAQIVMDFGDGEIYQALFEGIGPATAHVGAQIILVRQRGPWPARAISAQQTALQGTLNSLLKQSESWNECLETVSASVHDSRHVFLTGEPGVGKHLVGLASLPEGAMILDSADAACTTATVRAAMNSGLPILIGNLQTLDTQRLGDFMTLLNKNRGRDQAIVSTATISRSDRRLPVDLEAFPGATVLVPALRDRLEDLPELVKSLTLRHTPFGSEPVRWMAEAIQILARADWLENVRSLDAMIRHVVRGNRTGVVNAASLPDVVGAHGSGRQLSRLERLEANEILASLRDARGNKLTAARSLGMSRSTLYRRMGALGMTFTGSTY